MRTGAERVAQAGEHAVVAAQAEMLVEAEDPGQQRGKQRPIVARRRELVRPQPLGELRRDLGVMPRCRQRGEDAARTATHQQVDGHAFAHQHVRHPDRRCALDAAGAHDHGDPLASAHPFPCERAAAPQFE
jgi:hypothetical protein